MTVLMHTIISHRDALEQAHYYLYQKTFKSGTSQKLHLSFLPRIYSKQLREATCQENELCRPTSGPTLQWLVCLRMPLSYPSPKPCRDIMSQRLAGILTYSGSAACQQDKCYIQTVQSILWRQKNLKRRTVHCRQDGRNERLRLHVTDLLLLMAQARIKQMLLRLLTPSKGGHTAISMRGGSHVHIRGWEQNIIKIPTNCDKARGLVQSTHQAFQLTSNN